MAQFTSKNTKGFDYVFSCLASRNDGKSGLEKKIELTMFIYRYLSKGGHWRQHRESGQPYFSHPQALVLIYLDELGGADLRVVNLMLLHDVLEDCYPISESILLRLLGKELTKELKAITKTKDVSLEEYLRGIATCSPRVTFVKLVDRLHNLRTLGVCDCEKKIRQVEQTRKFVLPILLPALKGYGKKWVRYADFLETEILGELRKVSDGVE